jgi:hypothetical protein
MSQFHHFIINPIDFKPAPSYTHVHPSSRFDAMCDVEGSTTYSLSLFHYLNLLLTISSMFLIFQFRYIKFSIQFIFVMCKEHQENKISLYTTCTSSTQHVRSCCSSVSIVCDYKLDDRGSIQDRGKGFFSLAYVSRPVLKPTQIPI